MSAIIGIDPGKEGAVATIGDTEQVEDMSYVGDTVDARSLLMAIRNFPGAEIIIERQQSMPGQGVSSTFQTGVGYGMILAVAAISDCRFRIVGANQWKTKMGLRGKDKEDSRALAIQLFPALAGELKLKKHHGRAEALLIAEYGRLTQ